MPVLEASGSNSTAASSLLHRVRLNDPAGWERLARVYTPVVYGWVRSSGVAESDAPDVVQDVFLEIARSVHRFRRERPGDTFTGWVRTITHRRVIDHRRRQGTSATGGNLARLILESVPEPDFPSGSCDAASEVVRRGLELIREEFEARTWAAFEAVVLNGMAPQDAAAALGTSVGAVYIAKSRIAKRLRLELDGLV
ncbi:MAG: sigma-70 family RNA polymerase sigma factor [Gemmataceae bacterium]